MSNQWLYWALASALFAAFTAIFAKVGLQGVDSDFAAFIRTIVIILALCLFLTYTGKWQPFSSLSGKNWTFLIISGLATGASIDKFSIVLVTIFAVLFLGERPSGQDWVGIALITGGVLTLALKR